jgi:predicted negative regulator of RcsB-dependent stress response
LIAEDKLDDAEKTLNISNTGAFIARYEELRGDIYAKQGKAEEARQAYEKSLVNTQASAEAQAVLQMKLENLGRS